MRPTNWHYGDKLLLAPDHCLAEKTVAWGLAERVGFEPTVPCSTPDFESGTFDHSATSPQRPA